MSKKSGGPKSPDSGLHKTKGLDALYKEMSGTQAKNPQHTHSPCEKDVYTAGRKTNRDDAQHIERDVVKVASSTILKMYTGVPGAVHSTTLKRKLYMNENLASKW